MAWTRVNGGGIFTGAASGNLAYSPGWTSVAGDLMVAVAANYGQLLGTGIQDSAGNTWTKLIAKSQGGANCEVWYSVLGTGGSLTVTAVGQAYCTLAVTEFSSGGGTISASGTPVGGGAFGATSLTLPNITITTPALVVAGMGTDSGATVWTAGSGYTLDYSSGNGSPVIAGALLYQLAASSSPAAPSATWTPSSAITGVGAAFLATAGSGVMSKGQTLLASGF
jgi:hypothetical protein